MKKENICVIVVILVIAGFYLYGEYDSEKTTYDNYMSKANSEIENRTNIIEQYEERESNLDKMIQLQKDETSIAKRMLQTDCITADAEVNGCYDADEYNDLSHNLVDKFDEEE
jgi:uncharacterized protein (UPF0333 family)